MYYVKIYNLKYKKCFYKYFKTEFERDRYLNCLHYQKLLVVEESGFNG